MKKLEKQAIGIVAQLFDLAEVPVDKRQEINDVAYDYVTEQLTIPVVSQQREHLIDFADAINVHDGDRVKIGKLVDLYLKSINCG